MMVGWFAGEEFDHEGAEGPDVGGGGRAGLVDDFGGHPVGRTDYGRGGEGGGVRGDAKVGH